MLGKVFSKGPEFYERLILSDSSKLDSHKENKKNYQKKIKEIEEKLSDVKKEISKSELIIKGKNLETEEKKLKKYNDEIDIEDLKVQEIIKKIEQVKT